MITAIALLLSLQDGVCDLKKTESGLYCDACERVLGKDDLLQGAYCKICNEPREKKNWEKARAIKVCVKKFYLCEDCDPQECAKCSGKSWRLCCSSAVEQVDRSPVVAKCVVCDATAWEAKDVKHDEGKHKEKKERKVVLTCKGSGAFPHVSEKAAKKP